MGSDLWKFLTDNGSEKCEIDIDQFAEKAVLLLGEIFRKLKCFSCNPMITKVTVRGVIREAYFLTEWSIF